MSRSDEAWVPAAKATRGTQQALPEGHHQLRRESHPWDSTRLPKRPGRAGIKREDQFLRPIQSAEGTRVAKGDALGG
jgi:hypothetical protein